MTRLRSLSISLAALILLISIISCKSDEGSSATDPVSTSLVGTWILTKITLKSGTSSLSLTPAQAQIESTIIAKADGSYTAHNSKRYYNNNKRNVFHGRESDYL